MFHHFKSASKQGLNFKQLKNMIIFSKNIFNYFKTLKKSLKNIKNPYMASNP